MDGSLSVYTKAPWTDYAQGRIWTVTHTWYTIISIVTGVAFGLVQQSLERIIVHLLAWICYALGRGQSKPDQAGASEAVHEDTSPLIHRSPPKAGRQCLPSCSSRTCFSSLTVARISSWAIISISIAWSVAGAFVTSLSADEAALSGSKTCGLWGLTETANNVAQDEDALVQGEKEMRAGQYARDCYAAKSTISLDSCLLFRNTVIPTSSINYGQQCPFVNDTFCFGTGASAVRFSTGLVDASVIGINAEAAPKFNRTTMCVPLNIEDPPQGPGFVKKTNKSRSGWWGFELGPVESEEYSSRYTFEQFGDPYDYLVNSYTMSTYLHVYSKAKIDNYWQPIPDLNIRKALNTESDPYSLTIMFISPCHIFYKEACNDPIFPANLNYPHGSDLWISDDSRARPLACIDWIETCTHDGRCLPPYEEGENVDEKYVFTRFALNKSTAYHSIKSRGATGLDAQYRVEGDTSLPLSQNPPQWIVESWRLFNTSLSRVQYDALDIANGTDWDKSPLYVQKMPSWAQGRLCHIFTFQLPKGYDNVVIGVEIAILLIPLAAYIMAWQTSEDFSDQKKRSRHFDGLNLIGIEWLVKRFKTRAQRKHERLADSQHSQTSQNSGQPAPSGSNQAMPNSVNYGSISAPQQTHAPTDPAANPIADANGANGQSNTSAQFGATISTTTPNAPVANQQEPALPEVGEGNSSQATSPSQVKHSADTSPKTDTSHSSSSKDP